MIVGFLANLNIPACKAKNTEKDYSQEQCVHKIHFGVIFRKNSVEEQSDDERAKPYEHGRNFKSAVNNAFDYPRYYRTYKQRNCNYHLRQDFGTGEKIRLKLTVDRRRMLCGHHYAHQQEY